MKICWIWSHHLHHQWKFKFLTGKYTWGNKEKQWALSTNFWKQEVCWHHPAMFCLYTLSTPPIIWILTEVEGDGIESRLSSYIFSTLPTFLQDLQKSNRISTKSPISYFSFFNFQFSQMCKIRIRNVLIFPTRIW